jgi:hypothetical protein
LFIAKGEVGEVRSQLYIAFDRRYITESELKQGLQLTDECSRLIQSFVAKVKAGATRGLQFKQVRKADWAKEILEEYNPEMYKRFYGDG